MYFQGETGNSPLSRTQLGAVLEGLSSVRLLCSRGSRRRLARDLVGTGTNLPDFGGHIQVVPEPAAQWLALASMICFGVLRRR